MPMFKKKPIVIEANQWFRNGDHPKDNIKQIGTYKGPLATEGELVRYYRRPDKNGEESCKHCGIRMHEHGWIDTLKAGHNVCPGDWIIKSIAGEFYPCKPDIFAATYEPVEET